MLGDVTADGVRAAVAEFDRLGRTAFLDRYGFGPARSYFLVVDGKRYDSKAIAGAAHGFDRPDEGPLSRNEFSGGNATVARVLERLGFEVVRPTPRPSGWAAEERILALHTYLVHGALNRRDPVVVALSEELNERAFHPDARSRDTFRNPAGVGMKLANFAALDPSHVGAGLTQFSAGDEETWDLYAADFDALCDAVDAIRSGRPVPSGAVGGPVVVRRVPIEQRHRDRYEITPSLGPAVGERREAGLVERFAAWLMEQGAVVDAHHYDVVSPPLRNDLADESSKRLWEAKADVGRASVRMALGQLLDYLRFEDPGWRGGVLLPYRPSDDLVALVLDSGRALAWPDDVDGFAVLEPASW